MSTSLIKTALGRTILVQHNTMNPRPYSRINLIQGTRGVFSGYPNRIYIEGRSAREHEWDMNLDQWRTEFEHPLWKKVSDIAARIDRRGVGARGHGGMDFVMRWRIVQCLREGLPLDQDVYDGAAWSAIGPLSEQSVAKGGGGTPGWTKRARWRSTTACGSRSDSRKPRA